MTNRKTITVEEARKTLKVDREILKSGNLPEDYENDLIGEIDWLETVIFMSKIKDPD